MHKLLTTVLAALLLAVSPGSASAATHPVAAPADEDGYNLWLRYQPLAPPAQAKLKGQARSIVLTAAATPTTRAAVAELQRGVAGMGGGPAPAQATAIADGALVLGTTASLPALDAALKTELSRLGSEGYLLRATRLQGRPVTLIAANTDIGLLYGAFAWLRATAAGTAPVAASSPKLQLRLLNHWDNLDRHVERGYAGASIWDWWALPEITDSRYTDYARANASLGINGTVLNNVNSKPEVLTPAYIAKAAAVADVLRPYGIKVFLSARFSTPLELKETDTADPLSPAVQAWWKKKADEIYRTIPDFGGFLVKANSEGQPGPQDYHRSHADGANMLAAALAPHHGIVMWRAFVYAPEAGKETDRARQAYEEFKPLDGKFAANVMVQVKNGAIDFQPREPFHPLFGAMPNTPLMMEFQITKEYLGFSTDIAYLGTMFEEVLESDTMQGAGKGPTVAQIIEGAHTLGGQPAATGMAGVANIGVDRNWTGHHFDQANWYAFGRLAWNPQASARAIAIEWAAQTFGNDARVTTPVVDMLMLSREAVVDYMTPLGLHHMMGTAHHHGPAPWVNDLERPDWNPVYYHRAARDGIGFDRTASGTNALEQYAPALARLYADPRTTPEKYLLWFHHLPWTYAMPSGRTLWAEIIHHYDRGVAAARDLQTRWDALRGVVDARRHAEVAQRLRRQVQNAQLWRNACIAYFQSVSGLPLPDGVAPPPQPLEYYKGIHFPYAPGRG
ncbi:UNVERIFIED_ORG: alpha-glucuronidase [Zoogloea ramigera]|uniref:Xylan alpha-1,2-glucuronidase n=1 Tax=Duganella zoogloeoides TaxID=75659 RepID=A0ABZ0Y754_9BURK|nr:alpha-glucuronidase family glycosyl hydrolase [Duganella zoogloeoides]WQH07271.1 alpha-glucuronidase family glycosyl hydrolase [Duganella zoogloeoides]